MNLVIEFLLTLLKQQRERPENSSLNRVSNPDRCHRGQGSNPLSSLSRCDDQIIHQNYPC